MDILKKIQVTGHKAPRITIYGQPGIGKSTLAKDFPEPLFLLTEESGLSHINAISPVKSFGEMWDNVKSLLELENPPFKTVIIDSISKLDHLIVEHILSKEVQPKDAKKAVSLATACGGYGAGYQAALQLHRAFKNLMDKFQVKGIGVVYIGHLTAVKYKAPDADDYDKYSIVMTSEKCKEPYIDDVDCVLFCRMNSVFTDTESGRNIVKSLNERIVLPSVSDGHISKNRFNMPDKLSMTFEDIKKYIPFYNSEEK